MADHALLLVGDSESNQNLYYKTRFLAGDPFVYFESNGRRVLMVGSMEKGRAEKESNVPEVRTFEELGYLDLIKGGTERTAAFNEVLARLLDGTRKIRVEGRLPVLYADALRERGIEIDVQAQLLNLSRRQKSGEEIEAIEDAQRATERATAGAVEILEQADDRNGILHFNGIPVTSERLRTEVEIALTREGLDPGSPIIAGGPRAADPHWIGEGPLRTGESIIMDVFPRSKRTRYFADMTRSVVQGDPGELLQRMYDATLAAQEAAFCQIRAGANGKDVHEAVLESYRSAGFGEEDGPRMTHGTGHGVGLDIHEAPGLSISDVELIEGDVLTIEPGLYDPRVGGVRIEDIVVVTPDGYRNLTNFPKRFRL